MKTLATHNKSEPIRVLVAESYDLFRMGINTLVQQQQHLDLVAETGDPIHIYSLAASHKPHVILLDIHLTDTATLEAIITQLQQLPFKPKILALTNTGEEEILMSVIRLGVFGIFGKHQAASNLLKAIATIAAGEYWFEHSITKLVLRAAGCHSTSTSQEAVTPQIAAYLPVNADNKMSNINSTLTTKESCVACLASLGFPAKKIADKMCLSEKTVRNYLTSIYEKIGVSGQVELCLKSAEMNFCTPSQPCHQGICPHKQG